MVETLHTQFAPLHLLLAALDISCGRNCHIMLEVDALEGVAFYRLNNFAALELVFLPNRDVDECSTDVLTLRPE